MPSSDTEGFYYHESFKGYGKAIPKDVSIVGIDDVEISYFDRPAAYNGITAN